MAIPLDIISIFQIGANTVTAILLFLTAYQCKIEKKTNNTETLFKIYRNDLECRKCYSDALTQLDKIMIEINYLNIKRNANVVNINKPGVKQNTSMMNLNDLIKKQNAKKLEYLFNSSNYIILREFGYHFEYIGTLVRNNSLPFDLVFELIRLPDPFWDNAQNFIEIMQNNWVSDFWEDAQYLRNKYIEERNKKKPIKDKLKNSP